MDQLAEFVGNHYLLSMIWIALVVMLVYSFVSGLISPVKALGTHDATLLINKENAVVIDIRPQAEFRKGHILDARQLKQEQINQGDFSSLEKFKSNPIIVVCSMGMSARSAASKMLKAGFNRVTILKGGMNAWTGASLPVTK
jgi:rhodanese-related sulfurtransferase